MSKAPSANQLKFLDQMTRKFMVEWAHEETLDGSLDPDAFGEKALAGNPYKAHALKKGWLTKGLPCRLTSRGWSTAASFLKR